MDNLINLPRGALYAIHREQEFSLTIELALTTGVRLLVCGNNLPFYAIAYELARRVGQQYVYFLEERIFFSRAETAIQLVDFLCDLKPNPTPLLITDLLARFTEEDTRQADELFFHCQLELERLSRDTLIFISAPVHPPLERLGYALRRITRPFPFRLPSYRTEGYYHGTHTASFLPTV